LSCVAPCGRETSLGIFDPRLTYNPFEYQFAYDVWMKQQQMHWLHTEISMASDISDWKTKLTEAEKGVIGGVLKGFTIAELVIGNNFWSEIVQKRIKKPEIQMAACTIASMETVHCAAYAQLNTSLGIEDFDAFLHEPSAKAKIDRLMETKGNNRKELVRSIAIFSAFNEGVSLFSAFAILMSFSRRDLLKGVGEIVAYSVRDESMHSDFGCWLFRQIMEEYPEMRTEDLKEDIYESARLTVELEDKFTDHCFSFGDIQGIDSNDIKQYIRHRTNTKLGDLGYGSNWKNVDKESVVKITSWFDVMTAGDTRQDFFSGRETGYNKGRDFDEMWKGNWK